MPPSDRSHVYEAREHVDEWISDARIAAYRELFEGSDALLTDEEIARLDAIDSQLAREYGTGLWGADEYGIVSAEAVRTGTPHVVCTYHPEIPLEEIHGSDSLPESTRERFNDALWEYCERVAELVHEDLERFLEEREDESAE